MDLAAFGEKPTTTFQIRSDKGNIAGYWVGPETPESAKALTSAVAPGWTLTKMGAFNPKDIATSTKAFPIPRSVVMESLREELLQRATDLACKSRIRPKEVSVTAALEASIGFIVGGAGSISFQATWETEKLCQ